MNGLARSRLRIITDARYHLASYEVVAHAAKPWQAGIQQEEMKRRTGPFRQHHMSHTRSTTVHRAARLAAARIHTHTSHSDRFIHRSVHHASLGLPQRRRCTASPPSPKQQVHPLVCHPPPILAPTPSPSAAQLSLCAAVLPPPWSVLLALLQAEALAVVYVDVKRDAQPQPPRHHLAHALQRPQQPQ